MQTYEAASPFSPNELAQLEYQAEFSTTENDTYVGDRGLNNLNNVEGLGSASTHSNPAYLNKVSNFNLLRPTSFLRASKHRSNVKSSTWQLGQGRSRDSLDTMDTECPLYPESFDYDQNGTLPSKNGFIHFSHVQSSEVYGEPYQLRSKSENPYLTSDAVDKSILKLPELTAEALDVENFRPIKRQISARTLTFEDFESIQPLTPGADFSARSSNMENSNFPTPSSIRKVPSICSFEPPSNMYPDTPRTSWEYPSFPMEPVHLKFGYLVFGSNSNALSPTNSSRNAKSPMAHYDYTEPMRIDPNSFEISGSESAFPTFDNNSLLTFEPQSTHYSTMESSENQHFANGSWANEPCLGQHNAWGLGEETGAGAGSLPNDNNHISSYAPLQPLREESEEWGRNGKMSSQGKNKGNDNNTSGNGNKKNEKSLPKTNKQIRTQPMALDQSAEPSTDKDIGKAKKKAKGGKNGYKNLATFIIGIPGDDDFNVKKKIFGPGGKNMKCITSRSPGAKIRLRGEGSGFLEWDTGMESPEQLQLNVSVVDRAGYERVRSEVATLLQKLYDEYYKAKGVRCHLQVSENPKNAKPSSGKPRMVDDKLSQLPMKEV